MSKVSSVSQPITPRRRKKNTAWEKEKINSLIEKLKKEKDFQKAIAIADEIEGILFHLN
ncbi:MAG TPA: hypothetical protein VF487_12490 [Chitinophagaceae bacterium]